MFLELFVKMNDKTKKCSLVRNIESPQLKIGVQTMFAAEDEVAITFNFSFLLLLEVFNSFIFF